MEVNLPSASYILPVDEIDLDLLLLRRYQNRMYSSTGPIPIWSANKPAGDYYEFEVHAEMADVEMDCKENQTKQLCHICNIEVPTAYLKEHSSSDMHKTFFNIIDNAMDRLKMHAIVEKHGFTEKSNPDTIFCEYCCDVVRTVDKNLHNASKKHEMAFKYCEKIKLFQNDYVDKDNFKQLEAESKDSKGLKKKKRSKKNAQKKADLLVELNGNKINEEISMQFNIDEIVPMAENQNIVPITEQTEMKIDNMLGKLEKTSTIDIEPNATAHKTENDVVPMMEQTEMKIDNMLEKLDQKTPSIDIEPNATAHKTENDIVPMMEQTEMKIDNMLEKLDQKTPTIDIEPNATAHKTENDIVPDQNNIMAAKIEKDVVVPILEQKYNMKTYLQGIQFDNASVEIGVTITFNTGYKVLVPTDNFHGLHRTPHGPVQCRLCRVLVDHEEQHLTDTAHMQYVQRGIQDQHCIRQLDGWIWSHCMICNEHVENKEVHIATYNHISRLTQAVISKGTNVTNRSECFTQTTQNYCNVCDIVMPSTKEARRKHRLTADHKSKVLSYSQAKKLNSVALQTAVNSQNTTLNSQNTAVNSQNTAANSQNTTLNSQNTNAQTKFYPAVKLGTSKNVTATNKTEPNHNAAKVQNVIDRTKKQAKCRICKVEIPNSNANIRDHLNGKLHKTNLSEPKTEENSNKIINKYVTNNGKTNPTAALAPPSTSKVDPKENIKNIDKIQTKTTIENPIEITDNQALCHICKTQVPNTKNNIEDHLKGKRHATNLGQMLSENGIVIQNGEYFCEVCATRVLKVNLLKHFKTVGHQNAIISKENKTTPNTAKSPLEIQAQNREESNVTESTNIKIPTKDNITCYICKVQIKNDEAAKKAHKDSDCHLHNLNKAFASKSETNNEIEVKVKSMICLLCNAEVKLSKIMTHIIKEHAEIADSLLDDSLKLHVYLYVMENNSYQYKCKFCNYPPFSGKFQALLHMLGEKHLNVFAKVMTDTEDQKVAESKINLEAILVNPSNSKLGPELNNKSDATNYTLLKALEVNEIVKTNSLSNESKKVKTPKQESAINYDAMIQLDADHWFDLNNQDCADIGDPSEVASEVQQVNIPEHSKTFEKQNDVLKQMHSNKTTQVMASESTAVPNNINIKELSCVMCVIKSRNSPSDIKSRLGELNSETISKYGNGNIVQLCSTCESVVKRLHEINTNVQGGNNDKVVKPEQEIDKTTNETKKVKPADSERNDEYMTLNTSAVDDWFDAEDQACASADNRMAKDVIPNYYEVIDNPEELLCMYCETIVPITDCKKHVDEPKHVHCVENVLYKLKAEKGGHYEFLQETADPSKVLCVTCHEIFEKIPKRIKNHLKQDHHDYCYQKLLKANEILLIGDVTSQNYNCKVCKVHFRANMIDHINNAKHKSNFLANRKCYNSRLVDEKVVAARMFLKDVVVVFTQNQQEYYCQICDRIIAATTDSVTTHVINKSHFEKFKNILFMHQIDIVSDRYYCIGCRKYLDEKLIAHLSAVSHKLNNNKLTYTGTEDTVIPKESTESNEKEEKPKPKEVTPKMMKTCESIFSYKNARLFCNVCKLEFDAVLNETNKHLSSKTHILMLEVMLSANGIEDRNDDYFCLICKTDIPAQLVMQHIDMYEDHKTTLIDALHAKGKHIFSGESFTVRIKEIVTEKIPEKIITHMRKVATESYEKHHYCLLCNVYMPNLMLFKMGHELQEPHRSRFSEVLQRNSMSLNGDVCYCKLCDLYLSKQKAVVHSRSDHHKRNYMSSIVLGFN